MPGKINKEHVEIMDALDGILHRPVLTVSALRSLWLPLPFLGSCPCLLLLISLPLWGTNQSPWSPNSLSLPPFPFQDLPFPPPLGTSQVPAHRAISREVPLNEPIACPAAPFAGQKGSNYRRTFQKARGRGRDRAGTLREH